MSPRRVRPLSPLSCLWLLVLLAASASPPARAACPPAAELRARLPDLGLDRGTRAKSYGFTIPAGLYEEAFEDPEEPAVERDGERVYAVTVVNRPVERLWRAINDQEHHGGRLVDASILLEGDGHGDGRLVFQHMSRLGAGRWWAVRIRHGAELFRASGGTLWEQTWELALDDVDRSRDPVRGVDRRLDPLVSNRGAWLLAPLGPDCTLIDYFVESDPGGFLSVIQGLVAQRALADAVEEVVEMTGAHLDEPHAPFPRPDGRRLTDERVMEKRR